MGVHVVLDIDPHGIDKADWARAYDDTLALLESWRPRLLGWGVRTFQGERVAVYARSMQRSGRETDPVGWSVIGDRESMQTAECQSLYRDLERYRARASRNSQEDDIVAAAAHPDRKDASGPVCVFEDKTQGYPYHFAVLAAGMLVEERFPKHAMVCGDIDRGQAERVRTMAAPILGRDLELPVRVDAARLLGRLATRYEGEALVSAFDRVYLGDPIEQHEAVLRVFSGHVGAQHWRRELAGYETPNNLGAIRLLIAWLNAGRGLREACHLACVDHEGPRFAPEHFVSALASTWVAMPLPSRETLFALQKPLGDSHTVNSLLASWALDTGGALGRHLRIHIEPETLASTLKEVFGVQGPTLAERLLTDSARHENTVRSSNDAVRASLNRAPEANDDSTESLATLRSPQAMQKNQRAVVHGLACATSKLITSLRAIKGWELSGHLMDTDKSRLLLVRAVRDRGPMLTEDAWDDILALEDVDTIAWLLALAVLPCDALHMSQTRRAFFENVELRRYAIEVGRDPNAIAEFEKLAPSARARTEP